MYLNSVEKAKFRSSAQNSAARGKLGLSDPYVSWTAEKIIVYFDEILWSS